MEVFTFLFDPNLFGFEPQKETTDGANATISSAASHPAGRFGTVYALISERELFSLSARTMQNQ
jgi:hypothetical protein